MDLHDNLYGEFANMIIPEPTGLRIRVSYGLSSLGVVMYIEVANHQIYLVSTSNLWSMCQMAQDCE